ncbi:MAG: 2-succinyl-5-enolpyruvyl-6-hydroxy-3-cyclohexene-1-carboxylic-acid synthase, partial [Owenweeksia sp.]
MSKTSAKVNAQYLARILKAHQCLDIVIAPGSRNAPMILAFTEDPDYNCVSVPDERAAAFTALGMTIGRKAPVAVICSSGSATVNFYPAVTEAFYQRLPLIIISADRPTELIDQGVGQTIRQENVFANHIVFSANLQRDPSDTLSRYYNQRLINEALIASDRGPVHINVPFDEPLYDTLDEPDEEVRILQKLKPELLLDEDYLMGLAEIWNGARKIMVLAGQMDTDEWLGDSLRELNEKSPFLVLSETVSNLPGTNTVACIDRLINTISEEEKADLVPDLLITVGGEVVSKMVKKFLKDHQPGFHWHIDEHGAVKDPFMSLQTVIPVQADNFFDQLAEFVSEGDSSYRDQWVEAHRERSHRHKQYLSKVTFSDIKVFDIVLEQLPENSLLHCANSTSIRYTQLFDHRTGVEHYANRGTSGIDGCTSTAVGHALTTSRSVTLITGDVAFLYDSNAFWNDRLPGNLRVIIINNQGGNIFRIIEGPEAHQKLEKYQETVHQLNGEGVANTFGLDYQRVDTEAGFTEAISTFYDDLKKPRILEVITPRIE